MPSFFIFFAQKTHPITKRKLYHILKGEVFMNIKRLIDRAEKRVPEFHAIATKIINREVVSDDENKKVIAVFTARDMALGAELVKKGYWISGLAIGLAIGLAVPYFKKPVVEETKEEEA